MTGFLDTSSSGRSSQQTRFNKKKTGAEESFVLDFAYNKEAVDRLYERLGELARDTIPLSDGECWGEWRKGSGCSNEPPGELVSLEVPIMSSKTFIFGYADIVIEGKTRVSNLDRTTFERKTDRLKSILIEVKSEKSSVLDLIKQLKSYSSFHYGLPVFIHLYDLEDREIRALKANGIHPVDGRLLLGGA